MPRKENGMLFEVHPAPLKDKEGRNYVYVRPCSLHRRTMQEIDEYCAKHYSVQPGEMTRALDVLMEVAKMWLADGDRIETPMGTFAPKLGLRREMTTADRVGSLDVELQGIEYCPTREFIEKVSRWTNGFRPAGNPDSLQLAADTAHLERALQRCLDEHGYATVKTFMRHTALPYYSARNQLDAWCQGERPRLLCTKMGGTLVYTEI